MKLSFRSLYEKVFGTKEQLPFGTSLKMINGYEAVWTNYNGKVYENPLVRACIDTIARNAAKLNPKHIRATEKVYEDLNNKIKKIISEQPNEFMNAYDFYYKVVSNLYLDNDSFIYIMRDEKKQPIGLYPINANNKQLIEYKGEIYIRFRFNSGKTYTASLKDDVIHLKRFFCENDILGGTSTPIIKALSFKHVLDEGMVNAIKTTQSIKGVLKSTKTMLNPEDIKKMRDNFIKDFLGEEGNGSGIGALDSTHDFKAVDINPKIATDGQIKTVDDQILNYFGLNISIIQSDFKEDQWNAFYESVLEPIAIMMGLEFTNKLFTYGERFHGNKIVFESNRLQYASNSTKVDVAKAMANYMTINEIREVFNLAPIPDGEKILQSLNFVDSSIANVYQVGKENKNEE